MGKASRWVRGLLGMKKDKEKTENPMINSSSDTTIRVKKRWSFARSGTDDFQNHNQNHQNQYQNPGESSRLRSYEEKQSMHAIAVAAATAAAADAAVVAAHAAVAVVRLTNQGRGLMFSGTGIEILAAVKIQTIFRGYLARRARRALKALVRIQALVRGFIVRKRTAATLYSIQALIRAQVSVRSQRAHRRIRNRSHLLERRQYDEFHSKRLSGAVVSNESPKIVEMDTFRPSSRSSRRINVQTRPIDEEMYHHFYNYYPTLTSPLPGRHSVPDGAPSRNLQEWAGEYSRGSSTAQSTPRFSNSGRSNAALSTPAKSVSGGGGGGGDIGGYYRQDSDFPNYMMNTESFCAKLRSHSAPRQRGEAAAAAPAATGSSGSSRKRMSLNEIMGSRNSFTGVRMNKSCAEFDDDLV